MKKLWELFERLFLSPLPEEKPPAPPVDEFVFAAGKFVEREVDMSRPGSVEFEAWVPESGRPSEWGGHGAEVFAIYDGRRGHGHNLAAVMPFKCKTCTGRTCHEPRYSVPWDAWRKVSIAWNAGGSRIGVQIEGWGKPIALEFEEPWLAPVRAVYGHVPDGNHPGGHLLVGARMRKIRWGGEP